MIDYCAYKKEFDIPYLMSRSQSEIGLVRRTRDLRWLSGCEE